MPAGAEVCEWRVMKLLLPVLEKLQAGFSCFYGKELGCRGEAVPQRNGKDIQRSSSLPL